MGGAFMLAFTGLLAAPIFFGLLGGSKYIAILAILREGKGRYREHHGEGKLSQHYAVIVDLEADLAGAHIRVLADVFEELRPFVGKRFEFATSEYESLAHLLTAIQSHPTHKRLMKALEDRQHATQDSARQEIDEEILLHAYRLRPAITPLVDYLSNHDRGRVYDAA
jgi:hypothetical protein